MEHHGYTSFLFEAFQLGLGPKKKSPTFYAPFDRLGAVVSGEAEKTAKKDQHSHGRETKYQWPSLKF